MKHLLKLLPLILVLNSFKVLCQGITSNWYFGIHAGLYFSATTPIILNNNAMFVTEGCATISDENGNLLFYTEGDTIWNKQHLPMANGSGLIGNSSSTQGSLIIKRPMSQSEYFVFTLDEMASANGLHYSVVNSILAAGLGSVTTKNAPLLQIPCSEKMTAVKHCNGVDFWVVVHAFNSSNFHAFLLTAAGVTSTAVISQVGSSHISQEWLGCMKLSPNGKKLAVCSYNTPSKVEIFDFNNTTGVIIAPVSFTVPFVYGCEFSPDGNKLYATGNASGPCLFQWDLCSTSTTAILASQYTQTVSAPLGQMQLAINGKLYVASQNQQCLGVVNFPNNSGIAFNYVSCGQSIAPKNTYASIPNFPSNFFRQPLPIFTYSNLPTSCQTFSFYSQINSIPANCPSTFYSNVLWNFGDPITTLQNSSNLNTPLHVFSDSGTYLVKAYYTYPCGIDSVRALVHVAHKSPLLSCPVSFTICKGASVTFSCSGAAQYNWNTGATTSSILVSPSTNTIYTLTGYNFDQSCSAAKIISVFVSNCMINSENVLDDEIIFFPNPASEDLKFTSETTAAFAIYNSLGTLVYASYSSSGLNTLNLREFQRGFYILIFLDLSRKPHKFLKL